MEHRPGPDGVWPLAGVRCVGSGMCCKIARCALGEAKWGPGAECPSLVEADGRHWCGEILKASTEEEAAALRKGLYIGSGCSQTTTTQRTERLVQIKREYEARGEPFPEREYAMGFGLKLLRERLAESGITDEEQSARLLTNRRRGR